MNDFDQINERIGELESALIELQNELSRAHHSRKHIRRNLNAIVVLVCFLLLVFGVGLKFKDQKWEWVLDSSSLGELADTAIKIAAIGGSGAIGLKALNNRKTEG